MKGLFVTPELNNFFHWNLNSKFNFCGFWSSSVIRTVYGLNLVPSKCQISKLKVSRGFASLTATKVLPWTHWGADSQWRGGSEAAEKGSLINAPQSYFSCLLVWDAYHVVGRTCNDRRSLRNTFEWMQALQAPSSSMGESCWRSRGAPPLEAPKNLHLTVPNSVSNIAQQ